MLSHNDAEHFMKTLFAVEAISKGGRSGSIPLPHIQKIKDQLMIAKTNLPLLAAVLAFVCVLSGCQ
jgi:hypothetical protein